MGLALAIASPAKAFRNGCSGLVDFASAFGGNGDGATNNAAALLAFGVYGRAARSCTPVVLNVSAGTYEFNKTTAFVALEGYSFVIQGSGSPVFQNSLSNSGPWIPDCFPNLHQDSGGVAQLIQTTAVNDQTVTLLTAANAALYPVGAWAVVMSEDIQISASNFSYPPNCNLFDYVQITSVNAATGVVGVYPPLAHIHLSTNIDGPSANTNPCGKARIWLLDTATTSPTKFNISHTYKNISVQSGPSPNPAYIGMSGYFVRWENCTLSGISPQITKTSQIVNCTINSTLSNGNEPDKLIDILLIDGTSSNVAMVFQSSSINNCTINNCNIAVFFGSGTVKNMTITNSTLALYGEGIAGSAFGHSLSTTIQNSSLVWAPFFGAPWILGGATKRTIDGVSITYASGVITVPKSTADLADWNVVPNVTHLNLATGASDYFTGDLGTVLVESLTEDATNIYYNLSAGWGVSLPAFANGKIYISRQGPLFGSGLSGCKEALQLNAATLAGVFPWNLYINTFLETDGGSGLLNVVGDFQSITVTVTNPTAIVNARFQITANVVDAITMTGAVPLQINIDITKAGTRVFNQASLTGKQGNDSVLLNGVAQTALPTGKWAQNLPTQGYSSFIPSTGPLQVAVSASFDPGSNFRKAAP